MESWDPEIVLQEVISDLIDKNKFKYYKQDDDWLEFFKAMYCLNDQICKKTSKLEY